MGRYGSVSQRPPEFELNPYSPLATGLVFAGLGRIAGSTHYRDSSPFGNHGTLTNFALSGATSNWGFSSEIGRFFVDCDGDNDYISVPNLPGINSACGSRQSRTVAMWIKFTTTSNLVVMEKNSNSQFVVQTNATAFAGKLSFRTAVSSAGNAYTPIVANSGTWRHFVGVHNGDSNICYLDGTSGTASGAENAPAANTNVLAIGSRVGTYAFPGTLSDVMIWNRIVSLSEIQALADPSNTLLSGLILPPRRVLWPVTAAGTAFKAYWANQATQVAI